MCERARVHTHTQLTRPHTLILFGYQDCNSYIFIYSIITYNELEKHSYGVESFLKYVSTTIFLDNKLNLNPRIFELELNAIQKVYTLYWERVKILRARILFSCGRNYGCNSRIRIKTVM